MPRIFRNRKTLRVSKKLNNQLYGAEDLNLLAINGFKDSTASAKLAIASVSVWNCPMTRSSVVESACDNTSGALIKAEFKSDPPSGGYFNGAHMIPSK